MKKSILFLLALTTMLLSCQKKEITLSGAIKNPSEKYLIIADSRISYTGDSIPLTDGKFLYAVNASQPGYRFLTYGKTRKSVFVAPGYNLNISFDTKNIDSSFQFQGKGANENIVLDSITNKIRSMNYMFVYSSAPEKSIKYLDSIFSSLQNYFEKEAKEKSLDPVFVKYQKASLMYENAGLKTILGLQKNIKDTNYYSYLKELPVENEEYLSVPSYQNFLMFNQGRTIDSGIKTLKADSIGVNINLNNELSFIEKYKSAKIKDYMRYSSLNNFLSYNGVNDFDAYYTYFKKHNTDSVYAKELRKLFAKKSLLAKGQPAPDFTCMDKDNMPHSLKDLHGKYVYIDFWATWCGPCRMELPNYIRLQNDYKGKDIVFVSVSLDEDKNSWLQMVNENKSEGLSLLANGGWNAEVARSYQIAGIPTFVLIDREGKIINSQAPRPSSTEIRTSLDQLLLK